MPEFRDDFEEFTGGTTEAVVEAAEAAAPEFFVQVQSISGGGAIIVPLENETDTMTVLQVLSAAGVRVATNYEYYVDGGQVEVTHEVGNTASITVIESVKGG